MPLFAIIMRIFAIFALRYIIPLIMKKKKKIGKIIIIICSLFILWDIGYSFLQYNGADLDGDFAESILPKSYLDKLMEDPLGIKTVIEKDPHFSPNRFFSHWIFYKTFRTLPFLLQNFTDPIHSVYLSCSISKLVMHIVLLILLTLYITGEKIFTKKFLITAAILSPFFQGNGFVRNIGLIDPSTTYSFFYALPMIFLLLFFLPFILEIFHGKNVKMKIWMIILWIPLAFMVCLSGPLNSGIVLIMSLVLFIDRWMRNFSKEKGEKPGKRIFRSFALIPKKYYGFLIPISFLALYSLYVGLYNTGGTYTDINLIHQFQKLPYGIVKFFVSTPWIIILALIAVNYTLIAKYFKQDAAGKRLFSLLKFAGAFTLLYILLLPLGGYRDYRPDILRYDTMIPVIVLALILIGVSTTYLIGKWNFSIRVIYCSCIIPLLLFFTVSDKRKIFNECEKQSLVYIAQSKEDIVVLHNDCAVVNWYPIYRPEESKELGELLYIWRITDKPKLYYNLPPHSAQD